MKRVSKQMTVSIPPELYARAMRYAKREMRSRSGLVCEALREYVARKEKVHEVRLELARKLKKKGIRTLEDIERMVDEERDYVARLRESCARGLEDIDKGRVRPHDEVIAEVKKRHRL